MFLLFSQNKVTYKIASIFWVYHTALCTTDPPLLRMALNRVQF